MSTVAVFRVGHLMVYVSPPSEESESELEPDSVCTVSARLVPVSSVSSPSFEDVFLDLLGL